MGQRSSVYLADDLAAAVKASGVPLAELIRRGLTAGTAEAAPPGTKNLLTASPSLAALPDGEPGQHSRRQNRQARRKLDLGHRPGGLDHGYRHRGTRPVRDRHGVLRT